MVNWMQEAMWFKPGRTVDGSLLSRMTASCRLQFLPHSPAAKVFAAAVVDCPPKSSRRQSSTVVAAPLATIDPA